MFQGIRRRLRAARQALKNVRRAIRAYRRRRRLTPQENQVFDGWVKTARRSKVDEAMWKELGEIRRKAGDTDGALSAAIKEAEARQTRREAEDAIRELGGDPDLDVADLAQEGSRPAEIADDGPGGNLDAGGPADLARAAHPAVGGKATPSA